MADSCSKSTNGSVPNVYLAILAERAEALTTEVVVEHRERRGDVAQGTMWGKRQRKLTIPKRLIVFVWGALEECRSFLRTADTTSVRASVERAGEADSGGR